MYDFLTKLYLYIVILFHCVLYSTFSYEIFCFCVEDVYEMEMNNLLVDVEIFSLCHKETLFQAEFQQYKGEVGRFF